jgi:hypothetical protein
MRPSFVNVSPRFVFVLASLCVIAVVTVVFRPAAPRQAEERQPKPGSLKKSADVKHPVSSGQPPEFLQRMLNGEIPKLTAEQIGRYVESRGRDALSLIVAAMLGEDRDEWLDEAAERFPDDPQVAAAMLLHRSGNEEAEEWIVRLKENDPGNSLGYLLSAKASLDGADPDGALEEFAALESTRLNDYRESWQSGFTDAYRSAGYQGMEAEWLGMFQVPVLTGEVSRLSTGIGEAMIAAEGRGDRATTEALGRAGMKAAALVGGRGERDLLINQLISVSMERQLLNQLDAFEFIPGDERLVLERLAEMDERIDRIKAATQHHAELLPTLTESELRQYTRRLQTDGELMAMEWLVAQRQAGE